MLEGSKRQGGVKPEEQSTREQGKRSGARGGTFLPATQSGSRLTRILMGLQFHNVHLSFSLTLSSSLSLGWMVKDPLGVQSALLEETDWRLAGFRALLLPNVISTWSSWLRPWVWNCYGNDLLDNRLHFAGVIDE